MSCRIHVIVQYANNFDQSGFDHSVIKDVHRVADPFVGFAAPGVTNVKAADAGLQILAFARCWTKRISCHFTHCSRERKRIPASCAGSPSLGARGKNVRDVYPGWAGKTKPRHRSARRFARWHRQPVEKRFQFRFIDFNEISAIERFRSSLDLLTQRLELQRILLAALLQGTKRIPDRFAGVLILAGLDDVLDKSVLFRRQVDVPCWHHNLLIARILALMANFAKPGDAVDSGYTAV